MNRKFSNGSEGEDLGNCKKSIECIAHTQLNHFPPIIPKTNYNAHFCFPQPTDEMILH